VRLAAARVKLARLAFARPLRTSRGEFHERRSVIFTLDDEEGRSGYGEAAPWPGFGTESDDDALAALEDVARLVCGADLEAGQWPVDVATRLRNAPAARAAIQGALWDLAARRAGQSLSAFLATQAGTARGAALRELRVSALLVGNSPEAIRNEATRARAEGFRAAKIKLGAASLDEDRSLACAAREGLGPGILLRGDANGAWSEADAREALRSLAEFDFDYIEQPVAPGDVEALARLRGRAAVRIAADESVATGEGVLQLIRSGAADVLVLKPAMLGGPALALETADRARQAGCDVVFSHAFESAVGAHHALHCAAAWGDPHAVHGLCTAGLFEDDVADPVACRGGIAIVPGGPGLGIAP
jgi:o-succinylbenzoate synthase